MRLNLKSKSARVGNLEIHSLAKVTELDSGLVAGPDTYDTLGDGSSNATIAHLSLLSIEKQLAIVVPCMNEEYSILEGVLHGIPHHCLIILVSNSNMENFREECKMLIGLCTQSQRHGVVVHQQDAGLASAFATAGMPHITTENYSESENNAGQMKVRNGKGEAMMIGTALAKLANKAFVGFIDADNFIPGAVLEYCKIFAAGLHHALHGPTPTSSADSQQQSLAMVRLKWKSKPKIVDGKLVPQESGRCSRVVNEWMNRLLSSVTGDNAHDNLIITANAGEHAMSIDLALRLQFATGYAVEPFQLIDAWERSGLVPPTPPGTPLHCGNSNQMPDGSLTPRSKVKIMQIETINPHIHDFGKGEEHILKMQAQGLSTIYHSGLGSPRLQNELRNYMSKELAAVVGKDGVPEKARMYPPMVGMHFEKFGKAIEEQVETMCTVGITWK